MPEAINISEIHLFNLLKPKLCDAEAEQLVHYVKAEAEVHAQKKFNIVSQDIKTLRDYLDKNFPTKEDLVREISSVRESLTKDIQQSKIDMIKWMFGFWITLVLMLLANFFLKLKHTEIAVKEYL